MKERAGLKGADLPCIWLICADPLRVLGFETLLRDGAEFRVCVFEGTRAGDLADQDLVIIDETAVAGVQPLIAAFRRMRPQVRLLVVGTRTDHAYTESVIGAGAQGYLAHASSEAELHNAVAVVRDGSIWAPRKVLAKLLERSRSVVPQAAAGTEAAPVFTRREREVLRLLVLGRSNREIAEALGVDEGTVKSHLGRLMRKAGVGNRTALTMRMVAERWKF